MFAGRPIIGIVGGIGSGKSFVASIFGEMGCMVINSDRHVALAYQREDVRRAITSWWGSNIVHAGGSIDRAAIGAKVFHDPAERRRLEQLLHPIVARMRDEEMALAANNPKIVAWVWDAPVLLEAGWGDACDALVFVESPLEMRQERVRVNRGWDAAELTKREKMQLPLDKKREMAKYIIRNTAGAGEVRNQVRQVLSRILAG